MHVRKKTLRFIEFLFIGVFMGLGEDLIAVYFVTDEPITFSVFWVVLAVALPFAFISEYVVDHPRFWKVVLRLKDVEEEIEGGFRGMMHAKSSPSAEDKNNMVNKSIDT